MITRFILTQISLIIIISSNSYATIIHVPGDYSTIQAAIGAADNGDEIILADGVYSGEGNFNIDMLGKAVTVCSRSGNPEDCIIDVQGQHNSVAQRGFYLSGNEGHDTVIRDLTIINGVADAP